MKLKPEYEIWTVHTYDRNYKTGNFYKFANESDAINFVSGEITTTCWGDDVRLSKHEEVLTLKHTIEYDVEVNES